MQMEEEINPEELEAVLKKLDRILEENFKKVIDGTYFQEYQDRLIGQLDPTLNSHGVCTTLSLEQEYETVLLCYVCGMAHLVEKYPNIEEAIIGHQRWLLTLPELTTIVDLGYPPIQRPTEVNLNELHGRIWDSQKN